MKRLTLGRRSRLAKLTLFLATIILLGQCTQKDSPPAASVRTTSVQTYAVPKFTDSTAFDKIKQYGSLVDKIYKDWATKNNYPSIAYGIVVGDQLVYSGATGIADIKNNTQASTKTLYRIASMSKSFTGMAILRLRDEGKLSLGDPVSKHIPDFGGAGQLTTDAGSVTILNLLTMSAGFPEDNPWGDRQLEDSDQDLLDQVKGGVSYSNVPGVTFEYSNLGFALLGKIVTNVSGMPYQKYITENIMKPIGMNDSRWEYTEIPAATFAPGYRWEDEKWKDEPLLHDGSYGAMGGLICSIEDYAKYVSLHLSAWPARNSEEKGPVKRSSIREMHQPWRVNGMNPNAKTRTGETCAVMSGYGYGLGWRYDCKNIVRISHSGGLPGYGSEWRINPDYNIGVVSFSNRTYGAPGYPNGVVLDTLIQLAGIKKRAITTSAILNQRKAEIVELLSDWKSAESKAIFAENFFPDHSAESRGKAIEEVLSQAGKINSVTELVAENQLRGEFTLVCEKKTVYVYFTLSPEPTALIQYLEIGFP